MIAIFQHKILIEKRWKDMKRAKTVVQYYYFIYNGGLNV